MAESSARIRAVRQAITQLRLFNANAGFNGDHDAFFNNLSVVPESSAFWFGSLATAAVYLTWCSRRLACKPRPGATS